MEDRPYIMAVFSDDELPTAIGRNVQNIRLASEVTGYTIDAVKQSEYEGPKHKTIYLDELKGLNKGQVEALAQVDVHTANDFLETESVDILALKGFGPKTLDKVRGIIEGAVTELEQAIAQEGQEEAVVPAEQERADKEIVG